jgi:signal transduction histidine kinase
MPGENDPNIEILLQKYAGGRMPPLADIQDPLLGLISSELLQVYHTGFTSLYSVPLGILLASPQSSAGQKWRDGNYAFNRWCATDWSSLCQKLREKTEGDTICELCDRRQAMLAEQKKDAIAYLCDNGLIDFAAPVLVRNQVAAILFCGQFKPRQGALWNPEMLQPNGCFRPLRPGEAGIDLHNESQQRILAAGQKLGIDDLLDYPANEISPQEIEKFQETLKNTAKHLSHLAISAHELDKAKIVDWIQNHITRALLPLSTTPINVSEVWKQLSLGLAFTARYFGLDYALALSLQDETDKSLRVLCQSGLPETDFRAGTKIPVNATAYTTLRSAFGELKELAPIDLPRHEDLPLFDRLSRLHVRGRSKHILAVPLSTPKTPSTTIVILGKFKKDTLPGGFSDDDRDALRQIVEAIILVVEIILLVEQLEETANKQAHFLEDVAHDIRTPIQNLIVQSDALSRSLTLDEAKHVGQDMTAQARRLNRMSARIWTMINIDRGALVSEKPEKVPVYQTLTEQRKFLLELAEKRTIQIWIDKAMESWPAVQVHKTLFSQTVLNLIDNAIKYSRKGTDVRVFGKQIPEGISLSFENRGIPIRDEDKEKIFERYYRTREAQTFTSAGTGIGLYIVKAFVAQVGGSVEVRSEPVPGSRDYITTFKLTIPLWR